MNKCIFCTIIQNGNNSSLFWEDNDFVAFLDKNPNTKGQTLVVPRKHYDSDILNLDDSVYGNLLQAAKKVANKLENGLKVRRVAMVCEGMGINHAHVKLYPMHGLNDEFVAMHGTHRVYYEKYAGYLSTLLGPEASEKELAALAAMLKNT